MRRWLKSRSKENSRAGLGDAGDSKASLSAVSSKSSLVGGPGDGLGNPLEVFDPLVSNAECVLIESYRFRNIKSNLAKASGIEHTIICATRKGNLSTLSRRY
jgi:hypothetical protein